MSDKRSVATDALDTLGTVPIDDQQKRDAIHLAVEPVIAGQILDPGDRVTVENGIATRVVQTSDGLGIVDPFLERAVRKGERFWLVMYPRTIKSLRHVWSHPAFPDEPVVGATVAQASGRLGSKEYSEQWLRDFCSSSNSPDYDGLIEMLTDALDGVGSYPGASIDGGSLYISGRDASGEIPSEFWDHVEIVLGRKVENRPTYFSCSC